jgi:hypothetical protein
MPVRSCPAEHVHCAFIRPIGQVGLMVALEMAMSISC